jgi:hypothetical protein
MFRRVNDLAPTVVAKSIVVQSGQPLFRYFKTGATGATQEITTLPLRHFSPVHGANGDTAASAMTDSVRSVRVRISSVYRDALGDSAIRTVEGYIRLLNSGLVNFSSCGEPPLGTNLGAALVWVSGSPQVRLTWAPSVDDGAGENDVERYALFRRAAGAVDWGEPFASIPAGLATYALMDSDVQSGQQWEYGVMSQDCTPSSSGITAIGPVTIP